MKRHNLIFTVLLTIGFTVYFSMTFSVGLSSAQAQTAAVQGDAGKSSGSGGNGKLTAVPRMVRDYAPQVFFTDVSGGFNIPVSDSPEDYNRIMNALNTAYGRKIPVSITFDPATKNITDIDAPKVPTSSGSLYEDIPDDSSKSKNNDVGGAAAGIPPSSAPGGLLGAPPAKTQSGWQD